MWQEIGCMLKSEMFTFTHGTYTKMLKVGKRGPFISLDKISMSTINYSLKNNFA